MTAGTTITTAIAITDAIVRLSVMAEIRKTNALAKAAMTNDAPIMRGTIVHSSVTHSIGLETAVIEPSQRVSWGEQRNSEDHQEEGYPLRDQVVRDGYRTH